MELYKYQPLQRGYTRVFILEGKSRSDKLVGMIAVIHIDEGEDSLDEWWPYKALSYCWGTPNQDEELAILDEEDDSLGIIPISSNLATILRSFAEQGVTGLLWIDQICINQSDVDEKSYLIGKMSLIYSNAESVLIWLAEENAQLGLAIQAITFMANLGCNERHSVDSHALLRHLSQAFDADEAFYAMEAFFALPWFSRLWVVQEACAAGKAPILMCGSLSIGWDTVSAFTMSGCFIRGSPVEFSSIKARSATELISWRWAYVKNKFDPNLIELFVMLIDGSRERQCFDPRDRYGAVCNLLQTQFELPEFDYNRSVDEIYITWTNTLLSYLRLKRVKPWLAIIANAGSRNKSKTLPSWVPDWNSATSQERPCIFGRIASTHIAGLGSSNAPADLSNAFEGNVAGIKPLDERMNAEGEQILSPERILPVKGILISNIAKILRPFNSVTWPTNGCLDNDDATHVLGEPISSRWPEWYGRLPEEEKGSLSLPEPIILYWLDHLRHLESVRYPTRTEREVAFARVMMNRNHQMMYLDLDFENKLLRELLLAIESLWRHYEEAIMDKLEPYSQQFLQNSSLAPVVNAKAMIRTAMGHRFIITEQAHFGLCPNEAEVGDIVVIAFGAPSPFVLRQDGNYFRLIGDCYVDGLMHGEAVKGKNIISRIFKLI